MKRWVSKLLATIVTFILPMFCTLLPFICSSNLCRQATQPVLLSRLMCLGGGIFFGTYLLHMGPDVRLLLDESLLGFSYPLAELLTGLGFFIVLFTETLVVEHTRRMTSGPATIVDKKTSASDHKHALDDVKDEDGVKKSENGQVLDLEHMNPKYDVNKPDNNGHAVDMPSSEPKQRENDNQPSQSVDQDHGHGHDHLQSSRSLTLVLALSLHRIFEGMSIGLQHTASGVGSLLLAVMCHETVIAFSLGLQFVRSQMALKRLFITALVCSVAMPIGVVIGIAMSETATDGGSQLTNVSMLIAVGVLQAIAVGTFIYVTFFEILGEQLAPNDSSLSKVFCVAIGFALMALLELIPEEQLQLQQRHTVSDVTTMAP